MQYLNRHCPDGAGLGQKITDNFGEAKLLDDIIDHWDAGKSCEPQTASKTIL